MILFSMRTWNVQSHFAEDSEEAVMNEEKLKRFIASFHGVLVKVPRGFWITGSCNHILLGKCFILT